MEKKNVPTNTSSSSWLTPSFQKNKICTPAKSIIKKTSKPLKKRWIVETEVLVKASKLSIASEISAKIVGLISGDELSLPAEPEPLPEPGVTSGNPEVSRTLPV